MSFEVVNHNAVTLNLYFGVEEQQTEVMWCDVRVNFRSALYMRIHNIQSSGLHAYTYDGTQ
jgi:hypothetical protein